MGIPANEVKKNIMNERSIQNTIRITHSKGDCRLFTNDQGIAKLPNGQTIRFGLGNDTSDLVGPKTIIITKEMVGKPVAVMTWIEVKVPGKHATKEQQQFLDKMIDMGCIAGEAHSPEEVQNLFDNYLAYLQSQ